MNRIEIATDDGVAPAFVFGPEGAPGVVMLSDGLGMRPAMHELAARLGGEGYRVLLPDLFYRLGAYTSPDPRALFTDPAVREAWTVRLATTTGAALVRDVRAWLDHFGGARVALVGYCMGGRTALVAAATYPDRVSAVGAYHPGRLVTDDADSPHRVLGAIRARVYIAAASDDPSLTDAQRATVIEALAGVDATVDLDPARHGFVPSDTPVHDPAAAERHWQSLLALLVSVG